MTSDFSIRKNLLFRGLLSPSFFFSRVFGTTNYPTPFQAVCTRDQCNLFPGVYRLDPRLMQQYTGKICKS